LNPFRSARLALDLLTAEGAGALARRALDRLVEQADRNSFTPSQDWPRDAAIPTLYVLATPPSSRLGGVQAQLLARRKRERAAGRPFALFYPWAGRYRLELERGSERAALDLAPAPEGPAEAPPEPEPGPWVRAIRDAFARCGASSLRIEGVAGLPFTGLLELSAVLPVTLALHDFALFCPRAHLVEEPDGEFCRWSRDHARCAACLTQSWPVAPDYQALRRTLAARLLRGVHCVVFPSPFLLRAHLELFPTLDAVRCRVEPPPLLARPVPGYRPQDPPRRIAFVGAAKRFKGAELFAEIVASLGPRHPEIEWHAFGGGDPALLRKLRAAGVLVHGYYRAGTLPAHLARHRIDLALVLSMVPESYGLTLDECALAHVPFLTFDLGAQSERAGTLGGIVVPLAEGAAGVAAQIEAAVD
jgi:glycosyltransferase involved in cell wall biosynthesis